MELIRPMLRNLLRHPLRVSVVDDYRSWRGLELYVAALHLAAKIEAATDRPHIGLMLPPSGLMPAGILATWMIGRTIVPINYLLPAGERAEIITNAELDVVITVQPMLERFGELPSGVRPILLDANCFKGIPRLRRTMARPADHVAALLYTSGTSGRPKGVMLTAGNLEANITQCLGWVDLGRHAVFMGVLPQFHCFGLTVLTLIPLWLGVKVVYTARFVPRRVLGLIQEHRATVFLAIPAMLSSLLAAKGARPEQFASIEYMISGGEPLPSQVYEGFRQRFGVTINEGYGLTETAPIANLCRPQDHKRGSVGMPLPGVEEMIAADGEVRIKGPNVMKGYYKLPEETAGAFDEEGFFKTGDIGRRDAEGHLFITGRLKEMMVIAGENVFPRTIEEVLERHPDITASAVLGATDPVRGEVPIGFVELATGAVFDEIRLRAHCHEHLASYQVPRRLHVLEKLPRSPTGKILRRELRSHLNDETRA